MIRAVWKETNVKCKIDLKNYEFFVMLWNVSTYILRVTKDDTIIKKKEEKRWMY